MLVEPVFGTSTKMHLYLWQITSARLLIDCNPRRRAHITKSGSAGTRTRNQRLKRALLYQLSYRPISFIHLFARPLIGN